VSDGNARRRGDDELPPDPWAGLADTTSPPPLPPKPGERGWGHPSWSLDGERPAPPDVAPGSGRRGPVDDQPHVPPPRRTIWHHPAVWVALLVLAGILLVGALLESRPSGGTEPAPDAVTASDAGVFGAVVAPGS
jgi:hypothetical protein